MDIYFKETPAGHFCLIENDLINREKSLLQTKRDRVFAEAAWELVQGKGAIR